MREVIAKHKADQTAIQRLKKDKAIVEVEMKNLKVAYTSLKDNMQVVFFLQLGSTEK